MEMGEIILQFVILQFATPVIFGTAPVFMVLCMHEFIRFDDLRSISYNELKSNNNFSLSTYLIWTLAIIAIMTPIVNICAWLILLYHNKKFLKTHKQQ